YETAHVVGYPYWMDTRLVAMNAGRATTDYAIWPDAFDELRNEPRAQLLLLNPDDVDSLEYLRTLFPQGSIRRWVSDLPGKDIVIFFIPPAPGPERSPNPEAEP
ncbi:MAG: hypothetical protein ACK2TX_07450, partial [Anaerolineales bacterium]